MTGARILTIEECAQIIFEREEKRKKKQGGLLESTEQKKKKQPEKSRFHKR